MRLGASERVINGKMSFGAERYENRLELAGLAGLMDPPHDNVKESVATCRSAGVKTVMITGDHALTAKAVAKELDIYREGDMVVTGAELDEMTDGELSEAVERASVFARVKPAHKLRIVKAFKKKGNTVAMTGDGVNDAPAVKEADIGVSMGKNGTEVTREASGVVLLDDNFSTIVAAVKEGRRIYANICKFIRYMLASNLGEVMTMLAAALTGLPIPLYPIQILWVNLVTDGLPGIALGLDKADDDIMSKPPIPRDKGIFTKRMVWLIAFRGILTGVCTMGAFATIFFTCGNVNLARTVAFMTLVVIQLVHSFECRSETKTLFQIGLRGNNFLLVSAAVSLLLMVCVVYIPFLQPIFNTVPLGWQDWLTVIAFTAIGPALDSFARIFTK
jgi:Ca2+-transporting ATPase